LAQLKAHRHVTPEEITVIQWVNTENQMNKGRILGQPESDNNIAEEVFETPDGLSVKVEFPRLHYLPKYERFEKRRTRIHAHNPTCINAVQGDNVKLMECRPLSKMKNFVLIEVIKDESSKS